MKKSSKDKVLIITQFPQSMYKRNMNQYQRPYYGSEYADIHLLIRRKYTVSEELAQRVIVHKAPVHNRILFLFYSIGFGIWARFGGLDVVLTEPSKYAWVGFVLKYIAGYFWVMDVWDPVWGNPPWSNHRIKICDRITFWAMSCADLFLLSCLPTAVKHIKLIPSKCIQLYNAINLSNVKANSILIGLKRPQILHLVLARYRIGEQEGFCTVLQAAEQIQHLSDHIRIHLVGHLDERSSELLTHSSASSLFQVHGFIKQSRSDFFRTVHIGLVPYQPLEHMSYIFPIKVLEHLSQGNVVIASNLPGIASMIQQEYNGLLFKPGDSNDLATCILRLHDDFDFWKRLSLNAIESVKNFDPKKKNQVIFEEIAKRRRR